MSAIPPEDTADLAADIFSRTDYELNELRPRDFKPWHLPRKQFVRRTQWAEQARKIFEERNDDVPFTYLGLPGIDLLDLRYLHEQICVPLGRALRFLGFNSDARGNGDAAVDLNTSVDEVTRLAGVDSQSEVIGDDFRNLAHSNSIAWKRALHLGPFDVVNLDLCDGIAADDPDADGSLYAAVAALLSLQARRPHPWALLVTTRIGRAHFHQAALHGLIVRFNNNLAMCQEFAEQCRQLLGLDDPRGMDLATCGDETFLLVTLVALCKWLMALGQTANANQVELASCQAYRVYGGAACNDLVSFALIFKPVIQAPADALGAGPAPVVDECKAATRIARRATTLKDVDGILAGDAMLLEELTEETALLLRAARYDPQRYREWLAAGAPG